MSAPIDGYKQQLIILQNTHLYGHEYTLEVRKTVAFAKAHFAEQQTVVDDAFRSYLLLDFCFPDTPFDRLQTLAQNDETIKSSLLECTRQWIDVYQGDPLEMQSTNIDATTDEDVLDVLINSSSFNQQYRMNIIRDACFQFGDHHMNRYFGIIDKPCAIL